MNRPNDAVQLKHLDFFAEQTSGAISRLNQIGGNSSIVINSIPASVNGGLWRDSSSIYMNCGGFSANFLPNFLLPTNLTNTTLPISFVDNVITVNNIRFQMPFTVTKIQSGNIFAEADSDGDGTTEDTICASLATIETNGVVSDYFFTLYPFPLEYNNLRDGDTIAVIPLDSLPDGVNLFVAFSPAVSFPFFFAVGKPSFLPHSLYYDDDLTALRCDCAGLTKFVSQINSNHFIFHEADFHYFEIYSDQIDTDNAVNNFSISAHRDGDKTIFDVTFKDGFFNSTWTSKSEEDKAKADFNLYIWSGDYSAEKYTFNISGVSMAEDVPENFAKGESATADNITSYTYTYTAAGRSAGHYQDTEDESGYTLLYGAAKLNNNGFTISGLADNLIVVDGNIFKKNSAFFVPVVSTYDSSYILGYKLRDGFSLDHVAELSLGTIDETTGTVTITSLDAIASTTTADGVKTYSSVTVEDKLKATGSGNDGVIFKLVFGNDIFTSPTYDDPAFLFENGRYIYHEFKNPFYFLKQTAGLKTSYNFVPNGLDFEDISVSGLKDLGTLSVDGNNIKTAGGTVVGDMSVSTRVTFYDELFPDSSQHGDSIAISGSRYIRLLYHSGYGIKTYAPDCGFEGSNGSYSYTAIQQNSYDGFVRDYDMKAYHYFSHFGQEWNFSISGLNSSLGSLTIQSHTNVKSGDTTVAQCLGNVLVLLAAALPDNPDDNSIIQFTSNPNNFSLFLANDVNVWNHYFGEFVNNSGGSYTFSASKSTVGWYLLNNSVRYHATELNGQSISLAGLRPDLGDLAFDEDGFIHSESVGIVGKMSGSVITIYQHALLNTGTTFSV